MVDLDAVVDSLTLADGFNNITVTNVENVFGSNRRAHWIAKPFKSEVGA